MARAFIALQSSGMLGKNFDSSPRLTLIVLSGDGLGHTFEQAHSILTACQLDQSQIYRSFTGCYWQPKTLIEHL